MNKLSDKLKLIFVPFLIIAFCVVVGYTFLNWLLIIKLQLFSVNEMVVNIWIPFILPFILVFIWLRPRIKLLNLRRKRGDRYFGYQMLAAFAIVIPTLVAQSWVEGASGTLSTLDNIKQIENQNSSKYYTLKTFYIDKNHYGVQSSFDVSGKYSEDFNMHFFVSLPILEKQEDTLNSICFAWLGKEYRKRISNNLDPSEKEKLFQEFAQESQKKFGQTDFNQFVYLDRVGSTDAADGFKASIKKCLKYNWIHSDVFLAINEPFANHNGNKFAWIFGAFGIGAAAWFLLLLFAKFDESSVEQFNSGVKPPKENDLKEALTFFLPREGFYITPIIIDLNILIFLLMVFSGIGFISFKPSDLLAWGANFRPSTTNGEWWRLLTSSFLHGGLMHLVGNMYGLLFVGLFLEPKLGKTKYAVIYLTTGIIASTASLYFNEPIVSIGASGAIFGLYGVFLALLMTKVFPKDFSKAFLTSTLIFIGYNLLMGFAGTHIDNAAHIGGLVSGFIIGLILNPQLKQQAEEEQSHEQSDVQTLENTSSSQQLG